MHLVYHYSTNTTTLVCVPFALPSLLDSWSALCDEPEFREKNKNMSSKWHNGISLHKPKQYLVQTVSRVYV